MAGGTASNRIVQIAAAWRQAQAGSFAWLIKNRRPIRDFVQRTDIAETLTRIAAAATPVHPYGGLERRRIKALSEEDAAGLLADRGMALALAAELNGNPGPMHVPEHAGALGLSGAQRAAAEELRTYMLSEARALEARIVALEQELDRLFGGGTADTGRLAAWPPRSAP